MRLAFGVSLDEAEEALRDVESRWRAALERRDLFGAYVGAVYDTYPVLERIFAARELADGMHSAAYWNLLQMADTQANRGGIFAGTVQALRAIRVETLEPSPAALQALASEITRQIEALKRAETELRALRELASRSGLPIVYDTNMLNHWSQPGDIKWREFLKGRGEQTTIARLVVPLRVIDELDRQKYGQGDLAKKAATAIRYLERVLKDNEPGRPVILRREDDATLEVWIDSDDRGGDADLSILRCAADLDNLHRATGARVLTDDVGMRLRAGQMGLKVLRLDEKHRKKGTAMSDGEGTSVLRLSKSHDWRADSWTLSGANRDGGPTWDGFAGAALFHGGLLPGVVIEHHPRTGDTAIASAATGNVCPVENAAKPWGPGLARRRCAWQSCLIPPAHRAQGVR